MGGGRLESAQTTLRLRRARDLGLIALQPLKLKESQRLDHLAAKHLGNPMLWWVLAALSDIGWGMQLPPGTVIQIPLDMSVINAIVG